MFTIKIGDRSDIDVASSKATRSPSPDIEYIEPGRLTDPVAIELDKEQDDDVPFIRSPSFSPTFPEEIKVKRFSPENPAEIKVKTEIFSTHLEDARWARLNTLAEVVQLVGREAADEAKERLRAEEQTKAEMTHNIVRGVMDRMAYRQSLKFIPPQKSSDAPTWGTESNGWTDESTSSSSMTWPSPPSTPPQGDDMHPPNEDCRGEAPDDDWLVNTIGSNSYYRFLIPDPATNRSVVAPYIKFELYHARPEVRATYGRDYRVYTRLLEATPVDYDSPTLTHEQMQVLDPDASYAPAIEKVIQEEFPIDLVASIRQYQYYRRTQYSIQKVANEMRTKEMKYLEKALEVLDMLEKANVLGRLLAHLDIITQELDERGASPSSFAKAIRGFQGVIPWSARDTAADPVRTDLNSKGKERPFWRDLVNKRALQGKTKRYTGRLPSLNHAKRCHRCRQMGHIRQTCPRRDGPPRK